MPDGCCSRWSRSASKSRRGASGAALSRWVSVLYGPLSPAGGERSREARPLPETRSFRRVRLLAFVPLHHLLDLLFHVLEVERGGLLHRRELNEGLGRHSHRLLDLDEAPELAGHE